MGSYNLSTVSEGIGTQTLGVSVTVSKERGYLVPAVVIPAARSLSGYARFLHRCKSHETGGDAVCSGGWAMLLFGKISGP